MVVSALDWASCHASCHSATASSWEGSLAGAWCGGVSCWKFRVLVLLEDLVWSLLVTVVARTVKFGCVAVTVKLAAIVLSPSVWVSVVLWDCVVVEFVGVSSWRALCS